MNGRLQLQFASAIQRRGTPITLRSVTKAGTPPTPNPPTFINPVVATNLAAGATVMNINATSAYGRIMQGDILTVAGQPLTVAGTVTSRPNTANNAGWNNVNFAPAIVAPVTAGTPITPLWAADIQTWAVITSFPLQVLDGELIQVGDLRVVMPALDGFDPSLNWMLVLPDKTRTIINLSPAYVQGTIINWTAQAR